MNSSSSPTFIPNEDQQSAHDRVMEWLDGPMNTDLTLGGYAGTGKTTLIQWLWTTLQERGCAAMSPTAKAAQVMVHKGIDARTIHSTIYKFRGTYEDDNGKESPIFEDEGTWQTLDGKAPRMLMCDESSMVNSQVCDDIRKRNRPTLWVGDHGQLAPIGGDPGLMRDPMIRLERIMRQSGDSPILDLAHAVRTGNIPSKKFADGVAVKVGNISNDRRLVEYACENKIDQTIVATNYMRHRFNKIYRNMNGFTEPLEENDRLICTFNDYRYNIFNGQIVKVAQIIRDLGDMWECWLADEQLDGSWVNRPYPIPVLKNSLGNPQHRSTDRNPAAVEFDFGYAITGHKSQGSEWDRAMVVYQDVPAFNMSRWGYTTVTRARSHVSVVLR